MTAIWKQDFHFKCSNCYKGTSPGIVQLKLQALAKEISEFLVRYWKFAFKEIVLTKGFFAVVARCSTTLIG